MLMKARVAGARLLTPVDAVVADAFSNDANTKIVDIGSYAYEGQKLKFAIQATEVTVNEERFDKFPATTFTFDMTKK